MGNKTLKQKAEEIQEKIKSLSEEYVLDPVKFIEMLKFQSKFTNYSSRNTRIIQSQNPHANFVASFKKLKDLGYNVKKGEKALYVFAPIKNAAIEINGEIKSLKELSEEEKEQLKQLSKEELEEKTYRSLHTRYKLVPVFDVSQTDISNEDIPSIYNYNSLANYSVEDKLDVMYRFLDSKNIDVNFESLEIGLYGYSRPDDNLISLSNRLDEVGELSTLFHELGHVLFHKKGELKSMGLETVKNKKEIIEIQADTLDIMLSEYFDIPITEKRKNHLFGNMLKVTSEDLKKYIFPIIDIATKELSSIKEIRQEIEQEQQMKLEDKSYEIDL